MPLGPDLATRFEQANNELIRAVESCSDTAWQRTSAAEGWTAAALAHHAAGGHEGICGLVAAIANGQPLPPLTMEAINHGNAANAVTHAHATKTEVLGLARSGGSKAAGALRSLSDEQLNRTAAMPAFGPNPVSARQVAEMILIGHVQGHGASFKATVA